MDSPGQRSVQISNFKFQILELEIGNCEIVVAVGISTNFVVSAECWKLHQDDLTYEVFVFS